MGGKIQVIPYEEMTRHEEDLEQLSKDFERFTIQGEEFPPLSSASSSSRSGMQLLPNSVWFWNLKKKNSSTGHAPCYFFESPLEIRREIYKTTMKGLGLFDNPLMLRDALRHFTNNDTPNFLPKFCMTSKLVREETIPVYLNNVPYITVSNFVQNQFLAKFLDTVQDNLAWIAIKTLEFNYFAYFPGTEGMKNSDLELVVKCSGLEKLKFTMHLDRICKQVIVDDSDDENDGMAYEQRARSVEELVEKYRFERLFECDKLKSIEWTGWSYRGYELGKPEVKKSLQDLAEWIKNEFRDRKGQKIETTVSWYQYR